MALPSAAAPTVPASPTVLAVAASPTALAATVAASPTVAAASVAVITIMTLTVVGGGASFRPG